MAEQIEQTELPELARPAQPTELTELKSELKIELKVDLKIEWCRGEKSLRDILILRKTCFPNLKDVLSEADLTGNHVVVRDQNGVLCGAYRVTLSHQVENFESEEDFDLGPLLKKNGIKAELAWACVHPNYRDGRVIHLLWRALAEYFKTHHVRYVFGLASIASQGSEQILDIMSYLKKMHFVSSQEAIRPRNGYFSENALVSSLVLERPRSSLKKRLLPSLLRAYLMAGALVCLQPVFDPDLDCYDFMTVLDVEAASAKVAGHFNWMS